MRDAADVHLLEVLAHDDRRLHEQPRHADRVDAVLLRSREDLVDGLLDAEVHDLVPVVAQDDVDEVLADVVHVALHGRDEHLALRGRRRAAGRGDVRLEVRDRRLHRLRGLQHERELHAPVGEELPDGAHPGEQELVDDGERRVRLERRVEVRLDAVGVAVDDAPLEPLLDRQRRQLVRRRLRGGHAVEERHQRGQRVVVVGGRAAASGAAAAVVDEVTRDLDLLVGDAVQRQDAARVHDRRVEPARDRLLEEHGVQDMPRGRRQAERDVGEPEGRVAAGHRPLHTLDGVQRLDRVAAQVVRAAPEREREAVEDEVLRLEPELVDGDAGDPLAHADLPVGGARLTLLVDGEHDDRRAVALRERQQHVGLVPPVLEVHRVDDRTPAETDERGLDDVRLRRVDDERQRRLRRVAVDDGHHVGHAVAADVVDAQVEHVRAFARLRAGELDDALEVAGEHQVSERARAVRVRALADREERVLLLERHRRVERRECGPVLDDDRLARVGRRSVTGARRIRHATGRTRARECGPVEQARTRLQRRDRLGDGLEVRGRRAAAAADDAHTELVDELDVRGRELLRREPVDGAPVDELRQAGVRQDRDRQARRARERAHVLAHVRRTRRAVDAEHVDRERVERGDGRERLRPEEHRVDVLLDGELHHQRDALAALDEHVVRGGDRGLRLQEVVGGLDEQHVRAALEQPPDLTAVAVLHLVEPDRLRLLGRVLPERQRRRARARTDRADDPARVAGARERVAGGTGDLRRAPVQLLRLGAEPVLVEHPRCAAERVGLDRVAADLEERAVDAVDDVGPGAHEHLVAALERVPAEVGGAEVRLLDARPHRAVEHDGALPERVEERVGGQRGQHRVGGHAPEATRRQVSGCPSRPASPRRAALE